MSEQLIISVSREYGSGGHEIAQKLAEYYKLQIMWRECSSTISRKRQRQENPL